MASSRAACVLGGVRLISSASTTLAKTGPPMKRNSRSARRAVFLNHVGPRDVSRHQVGRELDAVERQVERVGQRPHHQRFREPWHALQQAVAAGKHADQQFLDHLPLADDDLAELASDLAVRLVQSLDGVVIGSRDLWLGSSARVSQSKRKWLTTPIIRGRLVAASRCDQLPIRYSTVASIRRGCKSV